MPVIKKNGVIHDTLTGYDFTRDKPLRPLRAIRQKCLECCCGSPKEVRECQITDCTLWPYRHGKRPMGAKSAHERSEFSENAVPTGK